METNIQYKKARVSIYCMHLLFAVTLHLSGFLRCLLENDAADVKCSDTPIPPPKLYGFQQSADEYPNEGTCRSTDWVLLVPQHLPDG